MGIVMKGSTIDQHKVEPLVPVIRYVSLFLNLFSKVLDVPRERLSFLHSTNFTPAVVVVSGITKDEVISEVCWITASINMMTKLAQSDDDINEFGHSLMKSTFGETYGKDTLYIEQHLIKLYNQLPSTKEEDYIGAAGAPVVNFVDET